ncbi:Fic family protein [Runella slithyformis]|uniref:Filamentation induced by cAMP protein Fic n=1 Tax=Runella slithyformis (strain ATCC 29530 / DSM 19594 / LMG 11500 / NCIMB 11436 / LSU 4) TaxID=761193 RepID=A0A7U4E813_RUNSL|nr:Fic family protein [Runella slithyformis]AEI51221.1 filamentation induced by cAMP protein Fic [Runella slithyformis DSM 19594]
MGLFIHQHHHWPHFTWHTDDLIHLLSEARNLQGRLMGKMESLGFELRDEALLETLTSDVLKSAEIEGELLNPEQVRSSIAQRLGMDFAGAITSDRNVDGMVDMMIDATRHCFEPLTKERLFDWHAGLFPIWRSGIFKITVADWRKDTMGKMQVVSGAAGREKVHFQAPDADLVEMEMSRFLEWFNEEHTIDLVIKAAIAHLWFVTIHPFQDGNGRITRALTDMLLAQSDKSTQRFYSMSAQIRVERKEYYENLEKTQKGDLDITEWIQWFLSCLINALKATDTLLTRVMLKADFWNRHSKTIINERQTKILNKLLDGFEGKLTSMKWAKMAKCSKDTAIRDINDLINKGVLQKETAGGRSTNYELKSPQQRTE